MDAYRLGSSLRTLRIRAGWRQSDLAGRAGVTPSDVSRVERGQAHRLRFDRVARIAEALDAHAEISLRWHGGELDRVVNARHAAMEQRLVARLSALDGWTVLPEVSFSIYGERGVVDALAWHQVTGTILVIETKTELVDIGEILGTLDRKRRLARRIGAERGWEARTVAVWLLVAEGRTNRRRLATHRDLLRAALPQEGHRVEAWLRRPSGILAALSFMPYERGSDRRRSLATPKRVRLAARAGPAAA